MVSPFHSALPAHPLAATGPLITRVSWKGSIAFVANLEDGLPSEYEACDVLYTEMAWRAGYDLFADRAGVLDRSFDRYLQAHRDLTDRRFYLVTGPAIAKLMPPPEMMLEGRVDSGGRDVTHCQVLVYHDRFDESWDGSTTSLIQALARRYDCVGDPACGYGNTGRLFAAAGKRYVMSDINAGCITYIAEHGEDW